MKLIRLLGTIALISCNITFAQEIVVAEQDSSDTKAPVAINVVNIIEEVRSTASELKLIKRKANPTKRLQSIDTAYTNYKKFLDEQLNITERFISANPNRQKIDNRIKKWNSYRSKLEDWEQEINNYTGRNSKLIDDINTEIKTWSLTYDNAKNSEAPTELLSYVIGVRDSLKKTNEALTKETSNYLRLEAKVDRLLWSTSEAIRQLEDLKNSETYHLFHKRHNNLWTEESSELSADGTDNDDGRENLKSYSNIFKEIFEGFQSKPRELILFILVLVLVAFLIRYLRRSFIKFPIDIETYRIKKFQDLFLNHPILIFAFVSFMISRTVFLVDNEKIILNILVLSMLIMSIPIIKPYEPKQFKLFFVAIVIFFVLDSFKTYAWFSSLQYRFYLLMEASIALLVVLYFSRSVYFTHKRKNLHFGGFTRFVKKLGPVAIVLLTISIISNLFGYTNLTDITLMISIYLGIVGMLFYAILLITEGACLCVIHRHYNVSTTQNTEERKLLEKKVVNTIRFLIATITVLIFLSLINQLNPLYEFLQIELTEEYAIGSISFTIGDIILFFVILGVSFTLSSIISFLINEGHGALKVFNLAEGVPTAISIILRYIIIGFGFIFAISALGIDLSTFNLMAGALGLGIGFGLQTIISNFVSGIILIFERPILPGDSVQVDQLFGTVSKIGTRASVISTYDGAEVIVPNNNLISNDLINWTLSNNIKRIEIKIGTAYGSNPNEVLDIIKDAAISNEFVLKEPQPMALFDAFGDSSLDFILRFWVHFENGLQAKSDVSIAIYNGLAAANIEIPFPQRDVHIKGQNPIE